MLNIMLQYKNMMYCNQKYENKVTSWLTCENQSIIQVAISNQITSYYTNKILFIVTYKVVSMKYWCLFCLDGLPRLR